MNACVNRGVVELVLAIVRQKKLQTLAHDGLVDHLSAQRALDQNRRAIAHVAGDNVVGQLGPPDMAQRGIHRVHQIEPRIDQRAIEIENHQLDRARIEGAAGMDHDLSG